MEQTSSPTKEKEPVKITVTFPTNAYFMSGIRDFTLSMIKNMTSFPDQWAYRFQSVVDELCNNAIEYGSASMREIKVTFLYTPDVSIEITVEDSGTGVSKMRAGDIKKFLEERKKPGYPFKELRGRGLAKIVSEWTDELEFIDIETGGIRVRAKKYLKSPQSQPIVGPRMDPTRVMLSI